MDGEQHVRRHEVTEALADVCDGRTENRALVSAALRGPISSFWVHVQVETCALDDVDTFECIWGEPELRDDAYCVKHQVVPLARLIDAAWCERMAPQFPEWAAFWKRVAVPLLRAVE